MPEKKTIAPIEPTQERQIWRGPERRPDALIGVADIGSIPAKMAEGFLCSRYTEDMLPGCQGRGQYPVYYGDTNQEGELIVQNQDIFQTDELGRLTYQGMIIVAWTQQSFDDEIAMQKAELNAMLNIKPEEEGEEPGVIFRHDTKPVK